jgi:flagellar biosynthesis/type III secretory pathway protein FliH
MKRTLFAAAFGVTALALAAPASAQIWRADAARPGYATRASYQEARRAAYDNGYREGLKEGQKESRKRDAFDYRDERTYQRADKGYHREFGDRERYRQMFRAGYADGYAEAYRRIGYRAPGNGGRRDDVGRRDEWGRNGTWNDRGRYGGYGSDIAFQYGARDGYEKGVEDARERRSHDVLRHKWYRSGNRHYESRYGSKQQYADVYRQGFRQGYEQGYRGGFYR